MALPVIPLAHFDIKDKRLPGGKLTMKPFTVGQEAILLQIKDSENKEEILSSIKQIINECVVEPKDFNVYAIPFFLVELIFLKLRERSNGETIELTYRCNNITDDTVEPVVKCGQKMEFSIDLREISITEPEGHTDTFTIAGDIGIQFQYPSLETIDKITDPDDILEALVLSTKAIYQGDEVWLASDSTKEELTAFVSQIPTKVKQEIVENFFNKVPRVKKVVDLKCPKCGYEHKINLEGITDFFG